jgi:hypothetical protein
LLIKINNGVADQKNAFADQKNNSADHFTNSQIKLSNNNEHKDDLENEFDELSIGLPR